MDKKLHTESCEKAFGNGYAEVHEFLDQYSKVFPREHRKVYHHRRGIMLIVQRFGLDAARAAERHILEDEGSVPADHTYFHTEKPELIKLAEEADRRASEVPDTESRSARHAEDRADSRPAHP
jgi:hypothetical protein